ncbi:MAG TPA: nuclear transport factor 2 family protein [Methylomirabilota bacterium]|jgi:ketosteroid isomerase-like protein|nr:nuclear transport factor 2 family protein [Methylomirabilota bacterium]
MASDADAVRAANARFYRAFENLSLAEMEPLWVHEERVVCVHPGWPRLHGWEAVRESWAAIFQNTREMRFTLTDIQVDVRGELAWVTCTENILSEARGNLSVTAILATNLFEWHAGAWLMVHHHASHVLAAPGAAESETA